MNKTRRRKWWSICDISCVCNVDLFCSRCLKLHSQRLVDPVELIFTGDIFANSFTNSRAARCFNCKRENRTLIRLVRLLPSKKRCASKRDRTSDLSVNSRMLYLLSYGSSRQGRREYSLRSFQCLFRNCMNDTNRILNLV
jgi:hypothetical protein